VNLVEGLVAYTNLFTEEEILEMENRANADLLSGRKGKLTGESYIYSKTREMLLYGYHYQYYPTDKRRKGVWNNVPVQPFPAWGHNITQRLLDNRVVPEASDSLIINYYPQFGAIPPHVDHSDFTRPIISIRLLSDSKLSFGGKSGGPGKGVTNIKFKIDFPRGTLMSMGGRSGKNINHSIESEDVPEPTASITLRKVIIKEKPIKKSIY